VPFDHPFSLVLTVLLFLVFGGVLAYVDGIASKRPDAGSQPAE